MEMDRLQKELQHSSNPIKSEMKRILFYILLFTAFLSRIFRSRKLYMQLLTKAHTTQGVVFNGVPRYIHSNAMLDPLGKLSIGDNIVISTNVTILTHDYSYTIGLKASNQPVLTDIAIFKPVSIGNETFIGANSVILPGSSIGDYCIIGAGSVIKGNIENYSIMIGNPAKKVGDTRIWGKEILNKYDQKSIHYDKK